MSLVVDDTSPINYLLQIGIINLLPKLYGSILIPDAVLLELSRDEAPLPVKSWARALPEWVDVPPTDLQTNAALQSLDDGEQQQWIDGYQSLESLIATTNFRVSGLIVSQYLASLAS